MRADLSRDRRRHGDLSGLAPPELGTVIPIIEHLTNLGTVPQEGARLIALPAPVRGMASFPVRAVAVWDQ